MNPFGQPVEADGTREQQVPLFCACLLPVLRTDIGVRYSGLVLVGIEAAGCAALALLCACLGTDMKPPHNLWPDAVAYWLLIAALAAAAARERVRAKVVDLVRYTGLSRYFSGRSRVTAFPPDAWIERVVRLEETRPRLALLLARLLIPAYRVRAFLARKPVWVTKAVAEPLLVLGVAVPALLGTWLLGLPLLFVGLHAGVAAVVLFLDQINRSLTIYAELRENEEGAIVATKLAERLTARRNR
jgi:hypothetical protein